MMQKLWQIKQKLNYSKEVFDIVQFGSSVMEDTEPNDIDIAVIFKRIPIKEQLEQAQLIKKQIQKFSELPVHIKSFDLYSFFDESNFARENILFYGKSLIFKNYFAQRLGLNPKVQVYYSLINLKKKEKIRFHYMLKGKKGRYGLLTKYGGDILKPGLLEIFPEYEKIFVDSIKEAITKFQVKKIFY